MLFTKATEAGIQLEIGTLLKSKQIKALKIDVNKKRVIEAARDLHVDVMILDPTSDFQIKVGRLLKDSVSELEMRKAKEDLLEASIAICDLVCELPDNEDEAILSAERHTIIDALVNEFESKVKEALGENVSIEVDIKAYGYTNPEPAASA